MILQAITYNEVPELITFFYISVLLIYQFRERVLPDFKTYVFRMLCLATAVASFINYISCIGIEHYNYFPIGLNYMISFLYFLTTGIVPLFFVFYVLAYLYNNSKRFKIGALLASIPYFVLFILLLINFKTGFIYRFTEEGYQKGSINEAFYGFFYFYLFITILIIFVNRKKMDKSFQKIFYFFPIF